MNHRFKNMIVYKKTFACFNRMASERIDSLLNRISPQHPQPKINVLCSNIDLNKINKKGLLDASYGLVIGAGIGDSIGSYLEFSGATHNKQKLDLVMSMPGGGTWGNRVVSGQVTDDTLASYS